MSASDPSAAREPRVASNLLCLLSEEAIRCDGANGYP